jgi:hypothetical protein
MLKRLVDFYLFFHARRRIEELKKTYTNPLKLQEKALFSILKRAHHTEIGKRYNFESIKSIGDYQKRLPLVKYNDIKPLIEKTLRGKPDVLWPGKVRDFAITSGTTSGNKYIPISKELIRANIKAALDCLTFYFNKTHNYSLLSGRFLLLGGSTSLEMLESGSFTGDLSGITSRRAPFIFNSHYEPRRDIARISDWETKINKIVQKEVEMDIRGISGIPSWLLVFFNRLLEEASKRRNRKVDTVKEVWPNFSFLVHGGINFAPYKDIFSKIIGSDIYYLEIYPASEAFIAIQDTEDKRGLLLMLDYGTFYEFIPAEEMDKENPPRLTVNDVELGKNYAVVITNNSGLYSYILGDILKFVSLKPLRLIVTGRVEHFLSAFGEHLIVEEAEDAIIYACKNTGSEIEEFTAAPLFPDNARELPCHQWLVEFRKNPHNLDEFGRYLDERLRENNDDYNTHRGNNVNIGRPKIVVLKKDAFYNWMKSEGKLGGQHKVPRLKNDRTIAAKLLNQQHSG